MVEGMELLPKGTEGIGSTASRNKIYNQSYIAYYRDTGLDVNTKKVPTKDNLVWVRDEICKQDNKMKQIKALVAASTKRGH